MLRLVCKLKKLCSLGIRLLAEIVHNSSSGLFAVQLIFIVVRCAIFENINARSDNEYDSCNAENCWLCSICLTRYKIDVYN